MTTLHGIHPQEGRNSIPYLSTSWDFLPFPAIRTHNPGWWTTQFFFTFERHTILLFNHVYKKTTPPTTDHTFSFLISTNNFFTPVPARTSSTLQKLAAAADRNFVFLSFFFVQPCDGWSLGYTQSRGHLILSGTTKNNPAFTLSSVVFLVFYFLLFFGVGGEGR